MENLTEIVTIIDKSGSMSGLKSKTIEGFNSFLEEQKELDGKANFSLILFSGHGRENILFDSVDIKEVSGLNEENYVCGSVTAMYDAIGKSIKATKKKVKNTPKEERPEKVLFVILTDGYENDSRYYNKEKVFKMIDKMERKHNWSFIYLGANQDSFAEGGKMGVKSKKILNYSADEEGVRFAYTNISNYASSFRMAKSAKLANDIGFDDLNNGTTDTNK